MNVMLAHHLGEEEGRRSTPFPSSFPSVPSPCRVQQFSSYHTIPGSNFARDCRRSPLCSDFFTVFFSGWPFLSVLMVFLIPPFPPPPFCFQFEKLCSFGRVKNIDREPTTPLVFCFFFPVNSLIHSRTASPLFDFGPSFFRGLEEESFSGYGF